MERLVIMGTGPAGLTAAIYATRADLSPLILTGSNPGGLLTQTSTVENFPGFPDGVEGFDLVYNMRLQAERFGARFLDGFITGVSLRDGGPHVLTMQDGSVIETRALVIATGALPRQLGLEGETRLQGKGVSACATCDGAFYRNVPVVVIGGGDSAMEEASFLSRFASKVTVIHRRDTLRASKVMIQRAMSNPKIEFLWNSVVTDILGSDHVEGVRVRDVQTGSEHELPCRGYFTALGHTPNTAMFKDYLKLDFRGYIMLECVTAHTSMEGVFAAGDCADPHYRQAITAAGMGCRAAMDAMHFLDEQG